MPDSLYDTDFVAWTEEQARLLREGAASRRNDPFDWEHLAEEIESLGRSDTRAVRSLLRVVIEHLLKLEFSRHTAPRHGWQSSVRYARADIRALLDDSPSLKSRMADIVTSEGPVAAQSAVDGLMAYGEANEAADLRRHGGYTVEQIMQSEWFPGLPS